MMMIALFNSAAVQRARMVGRHAERPIRPYSGELRRVPALVFC